TSAGSERVAAGAATLELMDATSLRVGQRLAGTPAAIHGFEATTQAALLVEYHADDPSALRELADAGGRVLAEQQLRDPAVFSSDAADRAAAWTFRKGLYASVAGARPSGTTALLEDVVVPVDRLADTCEGLQELFARFAYADSVIFGHAKDGNIHFMLTDRFEGATALRRFEGFTDAMVDLVLGAGGNLKAEHGTGRAMAPYVRRQYGDELYDVMVRLKRVLDPGGILNPGVIIDDDPTAHMRNLKTPVSIEAEADRCVECGYCEPVCPSRSLTLTPRQRIVVRRASTAARERGDGALAAELEKDYDYDGVQTCAVDGMCQTACPVLINTGSLMKRFRREDANPVLAAGWSAAATGWGAVTRAGSAALSVASALPTPAVRTVTDAARAVLGTDTVPRYSAELPGGGASRRSLGSVVGAPGVEPIAVFLPACVGSMFGPADGIGATAAFTRLLERAGVAAVVPDGIDALCCGTPWSSKGYAKGHATMSARVRAAVRTASRDGALPVVCDASSCTDGFAATLRDEGVEVMDAVAFAASVLLPRLTATPVAELLALHPTCSSKQLGIDPALRAVGEAVATEVRVPDSWGCCAYAGDRGMLHPELTEAATASEAAEVAGWGADAHASCNRTCELGMTKATGESYVHVLELLERATR
uniref:FAD-linked oxidase C-terminal domain-containing protein n=1 Tax=uncultured Microbacterium sp. TaxID=191216 RepID=UPI0025E8B2F9